MRTTIIGIIHHNFLLHKNTRSSPNIPSFEINRFPAPIVCPLVSHTRLADQIVFQHQNIYPAAGEGVVGILRSVDDWFAP